MVFYTMKQGSNLTVVLKPSYTKYDSGGQRYIEQGKSVRFDHGVFETNDQEIIDLLLSNAANGVDYKSEGTPELSAEAKETLAQEEQALETTQTSCPFCPFKAQNRSGLQAHIRARHPDK